MRIGGFAICIGGGVDGGGVDGGGGIIKLLSAIWSSLVDIFLFYVCIYVCVYVCVFVVTRCACSGCMLCHCVSRLVVLIQVPLTYAYVLCVSEYLLMHVVKRVCVCVCLCVCVTVCVCVCVCV